VDNKDEIFLICFVSHFPCEPGFCLFIIDFFTLLFSSRDIETALASSAENQEAAGWLQFICSSSANWPLKWLVVTVSVCCSRL